MKAVEGRYIWQRKDVESLENDEKKMGNRKIVGNLILVGFSEQPDGVAYVNFDHLDGKET